MPLWLLRLGPYAALFAFIGWLWIGWSHDADRVDKLTRDIRTEKARADGAERRETAMKQAEAQRQMDTATRTEETERTTDALDRIEQQVATKRPVPSNAAAIAVVCGRLRREGNTTSSAYRAKCG